MRAGLLVGSLLILVFSVAAMMAGGYSPNGTWIGPVVLVIGLIGCGLAVSTGPDGPAPVPRSGDLRAQLADLDAMQRDGTLTEPEAKAKRAALIEGWGNPR